MRITIRQNKWHSRIEGFCYSFFFGMRDEQEIKLNTHGCADKMNLTPLLLFINAHDHKDQHNGHAEPSI